MHWLFLPPWLCPAGVWEGQFLVPGVGAFLLTADVCLPFPAGVWEGQFLVPGVGAFLLTADALAGSGDVAALLGDNEVRAGHAARTAVCTAVCIAVYAGLG